MKLNDDDLEWITHCFQLSRRYLDLSMTQAQADLLNREDFCTGISALLRSSPRAQVRLLIDSYDPTTLSQHRLMALARRTPSRISLRLINDHPEWPAHTCFLGDHRAGWQIPGRQPLRRINDAAEARKMAERFERLWKAGTESPDFRLLN